ncbi:MAG: hypothetical protein JWO31_949 [Phycisphaerales bacterium]|nr:hypothetical protein [Phycisphaerales bacterium]
MNAVIRRSSPAVAAATLAALAVLGPAPSARAGFVQGTLVVLRVGDGTNPAAFAAGGTSAQSVSLDVYGATTGALLGTHAMPAAAGDAARVVLSAKSDDHDGHLNLSADGQYLTFAGYRADPGSAYPAALSAAAAPRVVARVGGTFAADTSTTLAGAYSGVTITAAASTDGTRFWTVGGNEATGTGGLRYVAGVGGTGSVNVSRTQTGANADSYRNVRVVGGQLVANTASQGSFANRGAYRMSINGGLPAAASATASTATGVIVNQEGSLTDAAGNADADGKGKNHPKSDSVFVDVNGDGTAETAYTTGGKEDLEKWNLSAGGQWLRTDNVTFASLAEINALDYAVSGGVVSVFASTDGGIYRLADAGGVGGPISSAAVNASRVFTDGYFIPAGSGTQFRGLAVVPEPAGLAVFGFAAAAGLLARRRRGQR